MLLNKSFAKKNVKKNYKTKKINKTKKNIKKNAKKNYKTKKINKTKRNIKKNVKKNYKTKKINKTNKNIKKKAKKNYKTKKINKTNKKYKIKKGGGKKRKREPEAAPAPAVEEAAPAPAAEEAAEAPAAEEAAAPAPAPAPKVISVSCVENPKKQNENIFLELINDKVQEAQAQVKKAEAEEAEEAQAAQAVLSSQESTQPTQCILEEEEQSINCEFKSIKQSDDYSIYEYDKPIDERKLLLVTDLSLENDFSINLPCELFNQISIPTLNKESYDKIGQCMIHEQIMKEIQKCNSEEVIDVSVKILQVDCGSHNIGKLCFKGPIISESLVLYLDDTMFSCIPINSEEFIPGYSIIFIPKDDNEELLKKFYSDAVAVMNYLDKIKNT